MAWTTQPTWASGGPVDASDLNGYIIHEFDPKAELIVNSGPVFPNKNLPDGVVEYEATIHFDYGFQKVADAMTALGAAIVLQFGQSFEQMRLQAIRFHDRRQKHLNPGLWHYRQRMKRSISRRKD